MKIFINASNIRKSGALQVTLSFLEELKKINRHQYLIAVSEEVEQQINKASFPANCDVVSLTTGTPGSKGFRQQIAKLGTLEKEFSADVVFSVFAPTYWTPAAPHLAGFAYPWTINPDSAFIRSLPFKQRLKNFLENIYKNYFFKKNAQYHVVEEADVKRRLHQYLGIPADNIFVVNNTCNHHFRDFNPASLRNILPPRTADEFRLVTISSNFAHKNLGIIASVSRTLKQRGHQNVFFYVTLPAADFSSLFAGDDHIRNLGVVPAVDCPPIYAGADAMLLPTMLECFSASYPEAMIMKTPILTSDLSFARSICGNSALYFDPRNENDIADKIELLMSDKTLATSLVTNGLQTLAGFPTAAERAAQYILLCEKIAALKTKGR